MDKDEDIQHKYQKLATEYSKARSQVTVLKKAVLDEQTKISDLGEHIKNLEQTVRIRDQEMESLLFRNDQLTKRIGVLQQELQISTNNKKGRSKAIDITNPNEAGLFNEEFEKKIVENAQLLTSLEEKDIEIVHLKEKMKNMDSVINKLKNEFELKCKTFQDKIHSYEKDKQKYENSCLPNVNTKDEADVNFLKAEVKRWQTECDVLKSKPKSDDQLTNYYESQLSKLLDTNVMLQSETKTSLSENLALKARLENITLEHNSLKTSLENSFEELKVTNNNYKTQLDAMTEHLAAQNEKITQQCDEIQFLKHKLSLKK